MFLPPHFNNHKPKTMNVSKASCFTPRHFFLGTLFLLSLGTVLRAGPGPQYWESLRRPDQFNQLKAGDKVVYVCTECKTVSEIALESGEQAMSLCKEGANVSCPSCKMKTKVIMKRQRNDPPSKVEIVYVNEKGEECGFVAKPAAKVHAEHLTEALHSPEQFKALKAGEKVAYVCKECKTVSEITLESGEQAMDLCKEGADVACPSCKTKTKVVLKTQRNDPPARKEVVYVNDKGEECAFVLAKPAAKK